MSSPCTDPAAAAVGEATALGLQQRLQAAFAERAAPPVPSVAATPLEACLRPLLEALHWTGDARRLFEASPHLEPIESIGVLRAVLLRIGFRTIPARLALSRLPSRSLPWRPPPPRLRPPFGPRRRCTCPATGSSTPWGRRCS